MSDVGSNDRGECRAALLERFRKAILCSDIGASTKVVLLILLEFVNGERWEDNGTLLAWPTVGRLARIAHIHETNIRKALREAERNGVIIQIHRYGRSAANHYQFSDAWLATAAPTVGWAWKEALNKNGEQNRSGFAGSQSRAGLLAEANEFAHMPEQDRSQSRLDALAESIEEPLEENLEGTLCCGPDPLQPSILMPIAGGKERESDETDVQSKARRIVFIFPPERRGNVDEAVRVMVRLATSRVDLDVIADAARSYVEQLNATRFCKPLLRWLEAEPWQLDWAMTRASAAVAIEERALFEATGQRRAEAEAAEMQRQAAQRHRDRQQAEAEVRQRAYEASPLCLAPSTGWEGKKEAEAEFDDLRFEFNYRGNYDVERTYYLAICYERRASPAEIAAAATQEIRSGQLLQTWLVKRFPLPRPITAAPAA